MIVEVQCRCRRKFTSKTIKVWLIRRAGETKEQVTQEKVGEKIVKHIEKVPADPFIITRSFKEVIPYQNNPKYEIQIIKEPKNHFCQRCRNMQSMMQGRRISMRMHGRKQGVNRIPKENLRDWERRIGRALTEGRIKPQVVKTPMLTTPFNVIQKEVQMEKKTLEKFSKKRQKKN